MSTHSLPDVNRRIVMARRPVGMPAVEDFAILEVPMPVPGPGEMLVRSIYLSADPLQRYRMQPSAHYGAVLQPSDPLKGRLVGQIVHSRHPDYREGEYVEGMLGWQEYAISDGSTRRAEYAPGISRVDPSIAPISTSLGILGFPGVTAYFALLGICAPKPGETVVISSAAGVVGSLAGQIAKIMGARVVGLAGSERKVAWLRDELGFDAAIDYRACDDLSAALASACPRGIDAYFDNVGGQQSDTILQHLAFRSRVAIVGDISRVNASDKTGRADFQQLVMMKRALLKGYIVYDDEDRADEARTAIANWLKLGLIRYQETVTDGFENAPAVLVAMLKGEGFGKHLVRLGPDTL